MEDRFFFHLYTSEDGLSLKEDCEVDRIWKEVIVQGSALKYREILNRVEIMYRGEEFTIDGTEGGIYVDGGGKFPVHVYVVRHNLNECLW